MRVTFSDHSVLAYISRSDQEMGVERARDALLGALSSSARVQIVTKRPGWIDLLPVGGKAADAYLILDRSYVFPLALLKGGSHHATTCYIHRDAYAERVLDGRERRPKGLREGFLSAGGV